MASYPKTDLLGKTFGQLTVTAFAGRLTDGSYRAMWSCVCTCGGKSVVRDTHLKNGASTTCGCGIRKGLAKANLKHGRTGTPEYRVWSGIHTRCYNDKEKTWEYYGGRGIKVCARWRGKDGFENFFADMGERPSPQHTIERKKVNEDYRPSNCVWATWEDQRLNRRNTLRVRYQGKLVPLKTACEAQGINYYSARSRIIRGHAPFERLRG